ncbi:MAG: hypothetical protein LBL91_05280 [Lachnospiraceae bacterium]|jgi:hypothetical protein|nr:hypothetical protein [Lachnospiraceae bacterium]
MENATKALIIAGAIIIAIVLISLGVMVLGIGQDQVGQTTDLMTSQAVETFNSTLTGYIGDSIKGSSIRALFSKVNAMNAQARANQTGREVVFDEGIKSLNQINNSKTYKVEATYDNDGYISALTVTEKKPTTTTES